MEAVVLWNFPPCSLTLEFTGLRILASELREYVASIKIDKERWRE